MEGFGGSLLSSRDGFLLRPARLIIQNGVNVGEFIHGLLHGALAHVDLQAFGEHRLTDGVARFQELVCWLHRRYPP